MTFPEEFWQRFEGVAKEAILTDDEVALPETVLGSLYLAWGAEVDVLDFCLQLEDEFGVEITDAEISDFVDRHETITLGDIAQMVYEKVLALPAK